MEEQVRALLRPGETVRWTGKPDARKVFTWVDLCYIPIFLVYLVLFGRGLWQDTQIPTLAFLFVPFVLAIALLLQFFLTYQSKKKTVYCITNMRVMLTAGKKSQSIYFPFITAVDRQVGKEGKGKLIVGNPSLNQKTYGFNGRSWSLMDKENACVLLDVENVEQVCKLLCELINQSRMAPPPMPGSPYGTAPYGGMYPPQNGAYPPPQNGAYPPQYPQNGGYPPQNGMNPPQDRNS